MNLLKNKFTHCTGCHSYSSKPGSACILIKHNQKGKCPCTLCIVKTMCDDACQSFIQFENLYRKQEWG
jgi:hypothetical protein